MPSLPVVLTIAGSDCCSGAGAQADLKTFTTLGCYGLTALTSVVAEVPAEVVSIQLLDAKMVADQVRVLVQNFPIAAAKTGMLGAKAQVEAVIETWKPRTNAPLVVDPVMVSTSGSRLLEEDAMEALITQLFPLARVITPNMDEADVLLGGKITSRTDMEAGAKVLATRFGCAILLKGGHLQGEDAPDILVDGEDVSWFETQRIHGVHTHGTGCTYSAAITAGLANGLVLKEAVSEAKAFVTQAIAQHHHWNGIDALNHSAKVQTY